MLAALLIASGFVFMDRRLSTGGPTVNLDRLPLVLGEWRGQRFAVEKRILQILETDYILDRDYVNPSGKHVHLSIVYYPDNRIGFHNPESCNTGVGSRVIQRDVQPIRSKQDLQSEEFKVNRLILEQVNGSKMILYFFVSGEYMTHNYLKFRLHMMKQQMGFQRPSGAQVQIQCPITPHPEQTLSIMGDFIHQLTPVLAGYLG